MRQRSLIGLEARGFYKTAYTEWGDPSNPKVIICVHGLARTGRDFDYLAHDLQSDYRIICPDVVGRGQSDWLENKEGYDLPLYVADMIRLLARIDVEEVIWIGTSMGGIIGMSLAAFPRSPIKALILNDLGPFIPKAALKRIAEYMGKDPRFATIRDAELYLRMIHVNFGPQTDEQWTHLTTHSFRRLEDGSYAFNYDPGIAMSYRSAQIKDVDLWPIWEAVRCPVLTIRGEKSDLLLSDTAGRMRQRPGTEVVDLPGIGHAPTLMDPSQIKLIRDWLKTNG
ncbi:MAG: alpha/beta hydrolase [Deltaproteobacteria bacterium]|nr:alpha/beta hydrolase [Deltaproteobacteria bacterium]